MKQKLLKTMLLLCALIAGSGTMWGTDVTYTISAKNTLSTTGTAPTSSSATMVESYSTSQQMTSGNSQTLTLSGWNGYTISSITLRMKSNKSSGSGKLKYSTDNGSSWTYIVGTSSAGVAFNNASWYGSWSQSYVDVSKTSLSIGCGTSNVKIVIEATASSLYCESYTITYAATPSGSEEATTTTIDASGITNTNKSISTAAGTLTAVVKDESDAAIGGASVTWTSSKPAVATIGSTTGVVTLVGKGTTTIRASYAGVDDEYLSSYDEYELTVIDEDPNALVIWSEDFATSGYSTRTSTYSYTTTGGSAVQAGDSYAGGSAPEMMVKGSGTFSATIPLDKYYGNLTLSYKSNAKSMSVSTTTTGLSTSGTTSFSTAGTHEVTFTGITASTTSITIVYSASENARLDDIELKGRMAAPQFSVPAGDVSAGTSVTLSATAGATIYYTTDGSTPTTSSSTYSSAFTIDETTTIKAIAVKSGKESSVGTATYTVSSEPFISLGTTSVAATKAETDGTITVTYNNLTNYDADIYSYEADGTTPATYDWIYAEINSSTKNLDYTIAENDTYSSRTSYLKVYALGDEGEVFSSLITITQAGKTVDFASLPFSFDKGKNDLPTGLTSTTLGSDYGSAPKLKFDNTGVNLILKLNEGPGELKFDIKGNGYSSGSTSTFTVQYSTDGSSYSDLDSYTTLGETETKTYTNIPATARYIKWIYTEKGASSGGNVALGNIKLTGCEAVSVGSAGYTTYTTTGKVCFPTGVKGYIATTTGASTVTLTTKESVPASTPIVLKASPGTYYLPVITTTPDDVTGNILEASDGSVLGDGSTIYGLGVGKDGDATGKIGFYLVGTGVTVPAGKAYLEVTGSSVKGFTFIFEDDDDPDSINEELGMKNEESSDGVIFNLAGQRISKLQKGINIINGKKILK